VPPLFLIYFMTLPPAATKVVHWGKIRYHRPRPPTGGPGVTGAHYYYYYQWRRLLFIFSYKAVCANDIGCSGGWCAAGKTSEAVAGVAQGKLISCPPPLPRATRSPRRNPWRNARVRHRYENADFTMMYG